MTASPGQGPMVKYIISAKRKPMIIMLLNGHIIKVPPNEMFLYP